MISMLVVAFITAAMVCVMSAFNGIDDLVKQLFSNFDAPLTILPKEGKVIPDSLISAATFADDLRIAHYAKIIEEDAWLAYEDRNAVATVKGVDQDYLQYSTIDSMIYQGQFRLSNDSSAFAVLGLGVRSELDIAMRDYMPTVLSVKAPIRGKKLSRHRENAFQEQPIQVAGVFSVNADLDSRYVFVPLSFAREVFGMDSLISSVELFLHHDEELLDVQSDLVQRLDTSLRVISRFEKNALIYQTNASEKWATFLILLFILLIACFNIIASLTMLIIEKKRDIFTLSSIGLSHTSIQRIFIFEGVLINAIGAVFGLFLGLLLCFLQETYGLIPMEGAMVENYPVRVMWWDVFGIFITVIAVGSAFSITLVGSLVRRFAGNLMMTGRQ